MHQRGRQQTSEGARATLHCAGTCLPPTCGHGLHGGNAHHLAQQVDQGSARVALRRMKRRTKGKVAVPPVRSKPHGPAGCLLAGRQHRQQNGCKPASVACPSGLPALACVALVPHACGLQRNCCMQPHTYPPSVLHTACPHLVDGCIGLDVICAGARQPKLNCLAVHAAAARARQRFAVTCQC